MKTPHSALQISAKKRFFAGLQKISGRYKYYLVVGLIVLMAPVVVGLTFAESDEADGTKELDETGLVDEGEEDNEGETEEGNKYDEEEIGDEEDDEENEKENDDDKYKDEEEDDEKSGEEDDNEGEEEIDESEGGDILDEDNVVETDETDELREALFAASSLHHGPVGGKNMRASSSLFSGDSVSLRGAMKRGDANLPSYYNSREQSFGSGIAVKKQNSESLCWSYATSSTIEYYIARAGLAGTSADKAISPKHVDYQMVAASEAYKTSNGKNALYERAVGLGGARSLGDGGTDQHILLAFSNPLALMSETDFGSVIKSNDSRLSAISVYEDIWRTGLNMTVLTSRDDLQVYNVKQNYSDINNAARSKYVVTGAKIVALSDYGESTQKTAAVNTVKAAVKAYGAVSFGSFWDEDNCMHSDIIKDGDGNPVTDSNGVYQLGYTIIDRGMSVCDNNTGHQMAIVGWDDSWAYEDNGVQKTGAFIVQNSWGDGAYSVPLESGGTAYAHDNFYLSYNSALDVILIDSVESLSNYDHAYSANDYGAETITPGNKELIFEFTSSGSEKLKEISMVDMGYNNVSYDVYVSANGTSGGFVNKGSYTSYIGINKFTFDEPIAVNGKFAIKLVRSAVAFSSLERVADALNAFTINNSAPASHTFTLTLNANGGSFATGAATTTSCTTTGISCAVTVPSTVPTNGSKVFEGWADSNTATASTHASGSSITLSADKTIYAVYSEPEEPEPEPSSDAYLSSLEVQFKINGETIVADIDPEFDKDVTDYEVFIREGYDSDAFEGGLAALVLVSTEDSGATVTDETVVVDDRVELMTITVIAEDGTRMIYRLTIYYPDDTPDVPDTGGSEVVPGVPNTGFKLKEFSSVRNAGTPVLMILLIIAGIGMVVIRLFARRPNVENESIIFVDKEM
ncbi:hypothetical protein IK146_00105 [Candidatus Saccharibacteria bacterium]|nr:hypothetical protein [Candidatus Saccharibacteria bacterium]